MTTDKIYTTLKKIRSKRPCGLKHGSGKGYDKLCQFLGKDYGDDTPVTFRQIYKSNGYKDTLWCLRCVDPVWDGLIRNFAVDCAEDVRHLMLDQSSLDALNVSRRYADGLASDEELETARAAAWGAAWAAASAAASDAASAAASDAAWAAAGAAAEDAAWDAAFAAAERKQMERLFIYCEKGERP